jgi:predicted Zn-ribbon and HTH transcriptional regulator
MNYKIAGNPTCVKDGIQYKITGRVMFYPVYCHACQNMWHSRHSAIEKCPRCKSWMTNKGVQNVPPEK